MERDRAIEHLKALIQAEERRARVGRPYLDKYAARAAEQSHWNNVQALRLAVDEMEEFVPIPKEPEERQPCPEPIRQLDEYYCVRCGIRWDCTEDKPPCKQERRHEQTY